MSDDKIKVGYSRLLKRDIFVGEKFNRLIIIERIGVKFNSQNNPYTLVKCQCDCGKIIITKFRNVFNNKTKSCGCLLKISTKIANQKRSIYKIGLKFGKLEIIAEKYKGRSRIVTVKCDCGKTFDMFASNLKRKKIKSCGCDLEEYLKYKVGDKFGRLIIKKYIGHDKNGKQLIKCLCDCGKLTDVLLTSVVKGHTRSCGCLHKEVISGQKAKDKWESEYLGYKKFTADVRNILFNLTKNEFIKLCQDNCYYCGSEPNIPMSVQSKYFKRNGIDRLDSKLGYDINNCVTSCGICNRAKRKLNKNDFLNKINEIYNFYFLKKSITPPMIKSKYKANRPAANPWLTEYKRYLRDLKRKKSQIRFDLSFEDFKELCSKNCFYCNQEPATKFHVGGLYRNGIDRVNNENFYTLESVVPACWNCNKLKNKLKKDDFLELVKKIYNNIIKQI